ncbi:MAG: hypothetical protein ABSH46_01610 [Bryobacteraceae bacterium]|jgi:hypothetical protein
MQFSICAEVEERRQNSIAGAAEPTFPAAEDGEGAGSVKERAEGEDAFDGRGAAQAPAGGHEPVDQAALDAVSGLEREVAGFAEGAKAVRRLVLKDDGTRREHVITP